MKIVEPKYEILTDISEGGIKELQQIERVARVCYKSEDKITPDGESAKKLVGFLVKQGHEAMLEHSQLSVLFTCDRGVANELIRHRIASFAQESTRYCNYSKEKFGGELTFIRPYYIDVTDTDEKRESTEYTPGSTWRLGLCSCGNYRVFDTTFTYSWAQIKLPDGTIIEGKVDNWTDYEGDQLQITIDGTTYLVHAANAIMKT